MSWWAAVTDPIFRDRSRRRRPPLLNVATDEGSGPVVILVHGIASTWATFRALIPLLTPNHRVIAIEILGFGESPAPADSEYTLEEHVAALGATIASLHLHQPYTLVGHSLGSLIVSRLAAGDRARGIRRLIPGARGWVSKVVLVGPPVYLAPAEIGDPKVRSRVSAYLRAYNFLRANKEFTLANAAIISRLLPKGIFEITEHNWTPFVKSLEHCIESQTLVSDIASLSVPVEVVYGVLDAFIAPGSMTVIERMRHVTMHRVEANDHLVRKRLARVVVKAIEAGTERAAPVSASVSPHVGSPQAGTMASSADRSSADR